MMRSSENTFQDLRELIEKALDGSMSPEELVRLDDCIVHSPERRHYYCEYLHMTVGLMRLCDYTVLTGVQEYDKLYLESLWNALFLEEKVAPAATTKKSINTPEVVHPKKEGQKVSTQKGNKVLLFVAVISLATLFFIMTSARLLIHREVATISTSLHAGFADNQRVASGARLANRKAPLLLQTGLIEIIFDKGAKVTLEAPAAFRLKSSARMALYKGKLFASVPAYARGFTVETSHSHIIDLGTEFGIQVRQDGTNDLHMFKGEAKLKFDSADNKAGQTLTLTAGQAKRVDVSGQISEIPIQEQAFVRHFYSRTEFVWRGQRLCLVDLVAKGNGLGTGQTNVYVDPIEGYKESLYSNEKGSEYHPLLSNPFVDGLFIPDGSKRQIVSSQAHEFADCPKTNGECYATLAANPDQGLYYDGVDNLTVRVVDPSAQGTPAFILADEIYVVTGTETGIELMPDDWSANKLGTGTWVHFKLGSPIILAANKRYGFDVTVTLGNGDYCLETAGVVGDSYADGFAYSTGTKGGTNSLYLDAIYGGDHTFVVELAQIGSIKPEQSNPKVSYSDRPPEIGPYDIYCLGESVIDNKNVGGFPTQTYSGDNDYATYIARDRCGLGQTFTTGSNPGGYVMKGFWLKSVKYTENLSGGNGTWWYLGATHTRNGIIRFNGQDYGDQNHPCLVMHANLGITFDLNAIRALCPGIKMTHFVSKFGVADFKEHVDCNADFWVLIDGQVRQSRRNVTQKGVLSNFSVEFRPNDRFLTLVTTDGGDIDRIGSYQRSYTCDWCVFVEPALVLEAREDSVF